MQRIESINAQRVRQQTASNYQVFIATSTNFESLIKMFINGQVTAALCHHATEAEQEKTPGPTQHSGGRREIPRG